MKRATIPHFFRVSMPYNFNPRPHEEGDVVMIVVDVLAEVISIHALMKRATFCQNIAIQHAIDFNPRPHEEGDIVHIRKIRFPVLFQSTPS